MIRVRNAKNKTYVLLVAVLVVSMTWLSVAMNRLHNSLPPDTSRSKTTTNTASKDAVNGTHVHAELLSNNGTINAIDINININSATGKVFRGERIRTYNGERRFSFSFAGTSRGSSSSSSSSAHNDDATKNRYSNDEIINCTKWNVVTTIYGPTEAVRRASNVRDWCTVIVADTKTPLNYMEELMKINANTDTKTNTETDTTLNIRSRNGDFIVFLSVEDQLAWMRDAATSTSRSTSSAVGRFLEAIPFRHFARKNIGYLYAIAHGAQLIFDFDDDNLLPLSSSIVLPPLHNTKVLKHAAMVVTGPKAFNHHSLMGAAVRGNSWPRGFPLTQLQNHATLGRIALEGGHYRDLSIPQEVGVLQFVADNNPDVDAIHRLVQGQEDPNTGTPFFFRRHVKYSSNNENPGTPGTEASQNDNSYYDSIKKLSTMGSLVVPSHTFVPYNAQASIHTYKAMFALVLPGTVKGRVSDIWRSYFSQRIFRDIDTSNNTSSDNGNGNGNIIGGDGLKVVILPPDIVHERNEHSLLADMQAEDDLYSKTEALLEFLNQWNPAVDDDNDDSIPSRMEQLWIDLYERDYIQLEDVTILQLWLSALAEVGYEFPRLPPPSRRRIKDVVLMGQFNFPTIAAVDSNNQNERNDEDKVKTDLLFWYQKWRQRFDTVVLRGPFPEHLAQDFRAKHEIDVRPTRQRLLDDRGFVSPMDNLLSTLKQYKDDRKINGVLYIHDDMLVNTTNIFFGSGNTKSQGAESIGDRTNTIYATHDDERKRTSFRIHPSYSSTGNDGNNAPSTKLYYSTLDGFRSDNSTELLEHLEPWPFNWECMYRFSQAAKDPRSRPFLEQDNTNGGDPFLLVPSGSQSDFLSGPTRLTEQYEAIAQLLIDHDVFLECGLPKITDLLSGMPLSSPLRQQKQRTSKERKRDATTNSANDVRLEEVELCTSWDYSKIRGTQQMIAECRPNTTHLPRGAPLAVPYSVIHPFKLTVLGYKDWGRFFDWATAGSSRVDLDD
jgi:hypothetical protein